MSNDQAENPVVTAPAPAEAPARVLTKEELRALALKRNADYAERRRGEWYTFPSGLTLRVRRLSLLDMAVAGSIPQDLQAQAVQMWTKDSSDLFNLAESMRVINHLIMSAVVEPRLLSLPPTESESAAGHLWIEEIAAHERLALYNWLNNTRTGLSNFLGDEPK